MFILMAVVTTNGKGPILALEFTPSIHKALGSNIHHTKDRRKKKSFVLLLDKGGG